VGGETPDDETVDTPFGSRLASHGTIRRVPTDDGDIRYVTDSQTDAEGAALTGQLRAALATDRARLDRQADNITTAGLHLRVETILSASSGLQRLSVRRVAELDPIAPGACMSHLGSEADPRCMMRYHNTSLKTPATLDFRRPNRHCRLHKRGSAMGRALAFLAFRSSRP
jgi:hypothetical protein